MPSKTKNYNQKLEEGWREKSAKKIIKIKSCMTKLIQAMIIYCTEDNSCLDERYIIILVNLLIQKSLGIFVFSRVDRVA